MLKLVVFQISLHPLPAYLLPAPLLMLIPMTWVAVIFNIPKTPAVMYALAVSMKGQML